MDRAKRHFIILVIGLIAFACREKNEKTVLPKSQDLLYIELDSSQLQEGDIVFRRGFGLVSFMIDIKMDPDYRISHVGVIIYKDGKIGVAQSLPTEEFRPDGVQWTSWSVFKKNSEKGTLMVLRPDPNYYDLTRFLAHLHSQLKLKKPFDVEFDLIEDSKVYCLELVWKALRYARPELVLHDSLGRNFTHLIQNEGLTQVSHPL